MIAVPASVEDATAEWLGPVLCAAGVLPAGDRITSVRHEPVGAGIGMMSQLHRLSYRTSAAVQGSVVLKLSLENELRSTADELGLYRREVDFYRDLAEVVPVRTPRAHLAVQAEPSTHFVLVLEDLGHLTPADQLVGLGLDQARVVVDDIAALHAWAWERPARLRELSDRFRPLRNEMTLASYPAYFEAGWASYLRHAAHEPGQVLVEAAARWPGALPWFLDELAAPATLCHGDLRADNLFFDQDGAVVVVDFQLVHQGCGISDIAYLGSQSVNDATRSGHEMLVRRYCTALERLGVAYPWPQAWRQYRIAVLLNLVVAVVATLSRPSLGPRGRKLVLRLVERAGRAIEVTEGMSLLPAS